MNPDRDSLSLNLSEGVRQLVLSQMENVNTAIPGIIIDYDPAKKSATIQPALNRNYASGDVQALPILTDVPVIFPSTNDFTFSFPIRKDDTCLVIFSERSIDLWKSVGGQITPNERRKFSLSDGIAIMGLTSFNKGARAQNNDDVAISYKGKKIAINNSGEIVIEGNSTIKIKANGDISIKGGRVAIGDSNIELIGALGDFLDIFSTDGPAFPLSKARAVIIAPLLKALAGTL